MKYLLFLIILGTFGYLIYSGFETAKTQFLYDQSYLFTPNKSYSPKPQNTPIPLSIKYMRSLSYPGSSIKIEKTLENGASYKRYIVSYYSDNLKQFAYMTIPTTPKPSKGFPVIIFNHGYQIPGLYTPEGNYIAYMDAIAKAGYVIFKPDFRGNGQSQGKPGSSYFSPNYAIDILNAISSIKTNSDIDSNRIGMWGHSMGGQLSLRVAEISPDLKAVVIWGGVVGSLNDIIYNWQDKVSYKPASKDLYLRNLGLKELIRENGKPFENTEFWNSIDPYENTQFIKVPLQIHVGLNDNQVPPEFSKDLYHKLQMDGIDAEYYEYAGANHDINQSFSSAMERTIQFYDKYLK